MTGNKLDFSHLAEIRKNINPKIGIVFILLIILQQYFWAPFISRVFIADYNRYINYSYLYVMGSYTLILLGIIFFRVNKSDFFSDQLTLWLIVLSCFLRSQLNGANELIYEVYLSFLGVALSVYILANRKSIRLPNLSSVFVGLLWSIGTVIVIALAYTLSDSVYAKSLPPNLTAIIVNIFVFQLSFVTVIEEAYFRGMVAGFMIMNGYKENTALIVQAVLFWGMHYMDISNKPAVFFIVVPLFTISATLMMKKFKVLYLPIIMHTILNVFISILATLFHYYLG